MRCKQPWIWALATIVMLAGCSGSGTSGPASQSVAEGPTQAVQAFLEAVRSGDDAAATALLSPLAREKLHGGGGPLTPPASDTASFEVGEVEKTSDDEATVACTWTDLDAAGQPQTDRAQWQVRRESEGWRIVGVAYKVFEDAPAVELNFEDPEDMARQRQWVVEEDHRRAVEAQLQAQISENNLEAPLRR